MTDQKLRLVQNRLIEVTNSPPQFQALKTGGLEKLLAGLSGPDMLEVYLDVRRHFRLGRIEEALDQLEELEKDLAQLISQNPPTLNDQEKLKLKAGEFIIAAEFPEAAGGSDKDIPLYFEKRQKQKVEEAKSLYTRLSRRYPDQEVRTTLLRCWRTSSPLYPMVNFQARKILGQQLSQGIIKTIQALMTSFQGVDGAVELMNRVRTAMAYLPAQKTLARRTLSRLADYSKALGYHSGEFASVVQILSDYLGGGLFQRREIVLIAPENLDREEESGDHPVIQTIDFGKVDFSPGDLKKILIPAQIQGAENQTLAYCRLYWEGDPALEGLILLYSQKFGTPNHQIYQTIRQSRSEGVRDEIILYRVFALLSKKSRYQYNIRKDAYMQSVWAKIKPGNEVTDWTGIDKQAYAQEQARLAMTRLEEKKEKARQEARQRLEKDRNLRVLADQMVERKRQAENLRKEAAAAKTRAAVEAQKARRRAVEARLLQKSTPPMAPVPVPPDPSPQSRQKELPSGTPLRPRRGRPPKASPPSVLTAPSTALRPEEKWMPFKADEVLAPRSSVMERIKDLEEGTSRNLVLVFRRQLEGITEDFVEEFAHNNGVVLTNYHRSLTVLAIKEFILNNLENPKRNWILSQQRQDVKDLGFQIDDVEPIIETCLKDLEKNLAPVLT